MSMTNNITFLCSIIPELIDRGFHSTAQSVLADLQSCISVGQGRIVTPCGVDVHDEILCNLDREYKWGNKVSAIKMVREKSGMGLKEAKEFVEAWGDQLQQKFEYERILPNSNGEVKEVNG